MGETKSEGDALRPVAEAEFNLSEGIVVLRALGHPWHWKRVYRVYGALRLNRKRRGKKRGDSCSASVTPAA
jgi:hypothetical protein